jgi:hypothetical protein
MAAVQCPLAAGRSVLQLSIKSGKATKEETTVKTGTLAVPAFVVSIALLILSLSTRNFSPVNASIPGYSLQETVSVPANGNVVSSATTLESGITGSQENIEFIAEHSFVNNYPGGLLSTAQNTRSINSLVLRESMNLQACWPFRNLAFPVALNLCSAI